jgi:SAM-dependent methyltransferase
VLDEDRLLRTETLSQCPGCGSVNFKLWRTGRDLLLQASARRFPYVHCKDCDLIFLAERPTPESIGLFYPENYHPYSAPPHSSVNQERRSLPERLLGVIEIALAQRFRKAALQYVEKRYPDAVVPAMQRFYKPPIKYGAVLLDFGCGSTWFLNRLRDTRWTTIAMDFMENLVDQARQEGHRGIVVSDSGWAEIEDASVDAVRMNHVLEHLYDPDAILSRLSDKLKPGGRIHIAVPNPRGLSARIFRSRWFSLEAPRHLMIYSPRKLAAFLESKGFVDIEVHHERTSKDFARSLGYFLRDLHLSKADLVPKMNDEPLLNAWLMPLLCLAGGFGYGDRIHAFALKG